jgi:hypothetical protein
MMHNVGVERPNTIDEGKTMRSYLNHTGRRLRIMGTTMGFFIVFAVPVQQLPLTPWPDDDCVSINRARR